MGGLKGGGVVVVDKPMGWTSHDVVAKVRRLAATRRVGHAGTLDPMATGVLVLGVDRATRLLGRLALTEKRYEATIRLGQATDTDDATGDITRQGDASVLTEDAVRASVAKLTGEISQVPSAVSAVKVGGQRAYKRVREGKEVDLAPREVVVHTFEVTGYRPAGEHNELLDLEAVVECSSGTYVRALARDLGADLGVGGHLTKLRRTRVGAYGIELARSIDDLVRDFSIIPIEQVAAQSFARLTVDDDVARLVTFGQKLSGIRVGAGPVALFSSEGRFLALYEDADDGARPVAVFAG